ncbi:hypothetical protein BGZ90_012156 [Linnemannia elongata]|nr:hypothetical protein BGZ90_012156 [Linnemannia elongata]
MFNILPVDRKEPIMYCSWLDARDVHADWACTSLRILGCPIGGIPRPDIDRELHDGLAGDYVLEGSQQENMTLQKRVLCQLVRLTHLRELRMGIPSDCGNRNYRRFDEEYDRQYDFLAMSLESGLDLLSDLRSLRVVALEDMEVNIDNENEKRWVAQNWPRAKLLTTF